MKNWLGKKPEARRYLLRMATAMVIYVGSLFAAEILIEERGLSGAPAYILAAIPGLSFAALFWIFARLIVEERDEFMRLLYVRQGMVATGLALTLFGLGLAAMLGQPYSGQPSLPFPRLDLPGLSDLPAVGRLLFSHDWLVYASLALTAGVWWGLSRTRAGLVLRAVGENHDAAHAIGYRVVAIRCGAAGGEREQQHRGAAREGQGVRGR